MQLYKNEAKYNETLKVWVLIISLANLILLKIQFFSIFCFVFIIYNAMKQYKIYKRHIVLTNLIPYILLKTL